MIRKGFLAGVVIVLTLGLCAGTALGASKSKKDLEAELAQLKDENSKLKQQVDDLSSRIDLLISRIDRLEKELAKNESPGPAVARNEIREESLPPKEEPITIAPALRPAQPGKLIIEKHHEGTPELPVVKIGPKPGPVASGPAPGQAQTQKVISFDDNKSNPNNPIIKIKKEPITPKKTGNAKSDSQTKKVITFEDSNKDGSEPVITEEKGGAKPVLEKTGPVAEEKKPDGAAAPSLDEIKKMMDKKDYASAEKAIKDRLAEKPSEKEACELRYYLGESKSKSGKSTDAAAAYMYISDHYPACDLAPGAMFKAGEIFEKTDKNKSKKVYEDLISLYPFSNYANLAAEKLKQ